MNHQFNKLLMNGNKNESEQQHFYESVDTLELPQKKNIHLGVNSCNFKKNSPKLISKNQNMLFNVINTSQNSNDLCFNTTSTSSSTTSSASSTNQFIRQMSKHQQKINNNGATAIQQSKTGSWSPDSAYYSSIPNYTYNNLLQQSHQRQPFNFNFLNQNEHLLNDNFKSQFV